MNNKNKNNGVFVCPDAIKNMFLYFSLFELLFIIVYFALHNNFYNMFIYYPLYLSKILLFVVLIIILLLLISTISMMFFAKDYVYTILAINIIYIGNKNYIYSFTNKKNKIKICSNLYITILILSSLIAITYIKAGNLLSDKMLNYIGILNIILGVSYILESLIFLKRINEVKKNK